MSKLQFRQNIFFTFDLRCLDLVRNCHKKINYLLNPKTYLSRIRIRSDPVFFGSPGSGSGSEKMDQIHNTDMNLVHIFVHTAKFVYSNFRAQRMESAGFTSIKEKQNRTRDGTAPLNQQANQSS